MTTHSHLSITIQTTASTKAAMAEVLREIANSLDNDCHSGYYPTWTTDREDPADCTGRDCNGYDEADDDEDDDDDLAPCFTEAG